VVAPRTTKHTHPQKHTRVCVGFWEPHAALGGGGSGPALEGGAGVADEGVDGVGGRLRRSAVPEGPPQERLPLPRVPRELPVGRPPGTATPVVGGERPGGIRSPSVAGNHPVGRSVVEIDPGF